MTSEYIDQSGKLMSREEVHRLPAEELADRSGHNIHIFAAHEELYDALADIMIEAVVSAKGRKTTMILPVGPTLHYPVLPEKSPRKNWIFLSCGLSIWMSFSTERAGRLMLPILCHSGLK
ncbi:MAG: hypothetical protein IMZ69_03240 [Spirochaetes bacterium]|nr:hypothetical protein [Spirochaetota bacterium]